MVKDFDEVEKNLARKLETMFSGMTEQLQQNLRDQQSFSPFRMLTLQLHVTFEEAHELVNLLQKMREEGRHAGGGSQ